MPVLKNADLVVGAHHVDVRALYDRAAGRYDHFRELWLRLGAPAEQALIEDLRAVLRPGARVLDAGCGTGALSREVLRIEPTTQLTMLDQSSEMLARAANVPGERILGSVLLSPTTLSTSSSLVG